MKTILRSAFFWTFISMVLTLSARASLIIGTDPSFVADSGTTVSAPAGAQEAPGINEHGGSGTEFYFVSAGTGAGSTSYGDSTCYPDRGDCLVKPVPEPGVGSIAIVGLIACAIMGRLIFRQII